MVCTIICTIIIVQIIVQKICTIIIVQIIVQKVYNAKLKFKTQIRDTAITVVAKHKMNLHQRNS